MLHSLSFPISTALLLLGTPVHAQLQLQPIGTGGGVTSLVCPASTCQECIEQGCGWAPLVGACQQTCSTIADVPCYSPSPSGEDVCAQVELDQASAAICRSVVDSDCATCTGTLQADGATPCQWHSPTVNEGLASYCGTGGCDMLGMCGSDTCDSVTEESTPPTTISLDCPASTCEECAAQGCGWVPLLGSCHRSCSVIADISCYSPSDNGDDMCEQAELERASTEICGSVAGDCTACTNTLQADGVSPCQWHSQTLGSSVTGGVEYCGTGGCDMLGMCGSETCASSTTSCADHETCRDCLQDDCAWTEMSCQETCTNDAAVCLLGSTADDPLASCAVYEDILQEESITCAARSDCTSCVDTVLSTPSETSGTRSCAWFEGNAGAYCSSEAATVCDDSGICGSTTCDAVVEPPVTGDSSCRDDFSDCSSCLSAGCAWAVGECFESCNLIADAACFQTPNSVADTCQAIVDDAVDAESCSQSTDCGSCTSTALSSDPTKTCRWFQQGDVAYCSNVQGCDFLGICGVAACPAAGATAIDVMPFSTSCNGTSTCQDCLTLGCAWEIGGSCLDSCGGANGTCLESMDAMDSCIPPTENTVSRSVGCATHLDCASCLSNSGEDVDGCVWYPDQATCGLESEDCDDCGPFLDDTCFASASGKEALSWAMILLVAVASARL